MKQPTLYLPFHGLTLDELVDCSVETIRTFQPENGYVGAFSGGKDSVALKRLAELAAASVVWHYHVTTIDPPELTRFIRQRHPDVLWDRPRHGPMLRRALVKGFPTRINRWCCAEYKEGSVQRGRVTLLGLRAAESPRRSANWKVVTYHRRTRANAISPMMHWQDADVWEFIRREKIEYCSLYDEGWDRLGCIGCPMSRQAGRAKAFARWPQFDRAWRRTFHAIWEKRVKDYGLQWLGLKRWRNPDEMYEWWKTNDPLPSKLYEDGEEECQTAMDMWSVPDEEEDE